MTKRQQRASRRSLGQCSEWDVKAADRSVFCDYHRTENRRSNQLNRAKRLKAGICLICRQPAVPGKARCQEHLKRQAQSAGKVAEKRSLLGLCPRCGKPSSENVYCENCRGYYREADQRRY